MSLVIIKEGIVVKLIHFIYKPGNFKFLDYGARFSFLSLSTVEVSTSFSEALRKTSINKQCHIIISCANSDSLQDLSYLQMLRDSYSDLQVVALFDVEENYDTAGVIISEMMSSLTKDIVDNHSSEKIEPSLSHKRAAVHKTAVSRGGRNKSGVIGGGEMAAQIDKLTVRQRDVLELLHHGLSNKEVARKLGLCEGTIKIHCLAIYRALDVRNRTEAVLFTDRAFNQSRSA